MNGYKIAVNALKVFSVIMVVFILFTKKTSSYDYKEEDFYKQSLKSIQNTNIDTPEKSNVLAGWGQANITPSFAVDLAGYGLKGDAKGILDSLWVKCIVLSNGEKTSANISFDLLLVHPVLVNAIQDAISKEFPQIDMARFSATHTHNSYGGWADGLLGKVLLGGEDDIVMDFIKNSTMSAVKTAMDNLSETGLAFARSDAKKYALNRLDNNYPVDGFIRQITLSNKNGNAVWYTFSAHPTFLPSDELQLSADYPGLVNTYLNNSNTREFAMFSAGNVGSHAPRSSGHTYNDMESYAKSLSNLFPIKQEKVQANILNSVDFPIQISDPELRITDSWCLRSFLFNWSLGEVEPKITATKLNDILILGLPCELSGEFSSELDSTAKAHGLQLMITSFNGDCMGYIIPEKRYSEDHSEAREMNWFGRYAGAYMTDYIKEIIYRFSEN